LYIGGLRQIAVSWAILRTSSNRLNENWASQRNTIYIKWAMIPFQYLEFRSSFPIMGKEYCFVQLRRVSWEKKDKSEGKIHLRTGHEGPERD
jgi:hypothetical protein